MAEEKPKLGDELSHMAEEPLLPVEKKLIAYSLLLGALLLGLLAFLSAHFFKG